MANAKLCKCGKPVGKTGTRCKACHAQNMAKRRARKSAPASGITMHSDSVALRLGASVEAMRQPRVTVAIVELVDTVTGRDAWIVACVPNEAAIEAGWASDYHGPFDSLEGAEIKARERTGALDAWAPVSASDS